MAKKIASSGKPVLDCSKWDDDKIERAFSRACKADDPERLLSLLAALDCSAGSEATHSKTPFEYAMEADAPRCFKALIDSCGSPESALGTRLWGGQRPIHHCAMIPSLGAGMQRGAPCCLAIALELAPGDFSAADDEGRTAMDWAAMNPGGDTFAPLFDAAARAKSQGLLTQAKFAALSSKAALHAVGYGADEDACMALLAKIGEAGLDWRELRSEHGQSLLGKCLAADATYSKMRGIGARLLAHGADPSSPFVREPGPYSRDLPSAPVPCVEYALDPSSRSMASITAPLLFIAFMKGLGDDLFVAKLNEHLRGGDDPSSFFEELAQGAGEGPVRELSLRLASVREAAALRASAAQPRDRRPAAPASL